MDLRRRFADLDVFWERHANPKSGWSRLLATPLILLAVYLRSKRILALALGWTVVNPVLFPRVDREVDHPSIMTRGVDAERAWLRGDLDPGAWERLNGLSAAPFAYALYAAYRRQPVRAAVAGAVSMALKLAFVFGIARRDVRRLDAARDD
ncbi:DUF6653 family protein [Halobaculum magnesiiphilum]|uniref:Uncharacterized protein n=1 Tax=Halobaculum magnesiiphilum TaxID=1017351 RepID=A0A8T8WBS5_9EURY|nr:DUF6653 family protein [Halobaculum magnesiiphilum]QZP37276.1 hypothetical protein K6T50_13460 [Halobaculum magnesiiphilum]